MKALISGQAAVAVMVDGDEMSSFTWDDPEILIPRRPSDLRLLFGTATDIAELPDASHAGAIEALGKSWSRDRAVHMALILFDGDALTDTRIAAAECLDEFLADPDVAEFVLNLLSTAPMPPRKFAGWTILPGRLLELMGKISSLQDTIRLVRRAWDTLPPEVFMTGDETIDPSAARRKFEIAAIHAGVFLSLAKAGEDTPMENAVLDSCLAHPNLAGFPGAATALRRWVESLTELITVDQQARKDRQTAAPRPLPEQPKVGRAAAG